MRSRRTSWGAIANIIDVSFFPPCISGIATFALTSANAAGCRIQTLRSKSARKSCARASRIPLLPPWPLMTTRLCAGSARAISRPRSRMKVVIPWIDSDIVPGAHSCSRARLIDIVGSCQRSRASPQREIMRRVKPSANTTSVLSGRWGPCCSIEPIGRQSIDLSLRNFEISKKVRSTIKRSRAATARVAGPGGLPTNIRAIVRIDRRLKRHPSRNLDSRFGETVDLGWIIRQEHDAIALEHLQHAGSNAVVALVVIEPKLCVGINRVEPIVLHLIGPHLVGEAKPASLLRQIKDDAAAYFFEALKREIELIAAVGPRSEEHTSE